MRPDLEGRLPIVYNGRTAEEWYTLYCQEAAKHQIKPTEENLRASHSYAAIDLVVTKDEDGTYHATGGPEDAMFGGSGSSSDEAIGSWFRQNREVANFQVSFVEGGEFRCSTRYGVGRSREQLGPNELKALKEIERHKSDERQA